MKQLASFFWGIPAALGALFVEIIIILIISSYKNPLGQINTDIFSLTIFGIIAAVFIEEIFKYLIIAKRIDAISLNFSYLINSLFFGLGFFSIETLLGYLKYGSLTTKDFFPLIGILCVHLITSEVIAYRIAINNPKKIGVIISTIILTTIFHSCYNIFIFTQESLTFYASCSVILILILLTVTNIFRLKKHLAI